MEMERHCSLDGERKRKVKNTALICKIQNIKKQAMKKMHARAVLFNAHTRVLCCSEATERVFSARSDRPEKRKKHESAVQ
jgi:hypothetical protein